MVALLPALATVIGIIVLAQIPRLSEVAGVTLVIAGVAVHRRPSPPAGRHASSSLAGHHVEVVLALQEVNGTRLFQRLDSEGNVLEFCSRLSLPA